MIHMFLGKTHYKRLVGGLEHFLFSHILGMIIPIDFHIFQSGRYTTKQKAIFASLRMEIFDDFHLPEPRPFALNRQDALERFTSDEFQRRAIVLMGQPDDSYRHLGWVLRMIKLK